MWIMVWVLLAGFVVGVYIWTTTILFEQKKAWKAFAAKAKLVYTPGKLTDAPSISGTLNGRRVSLFTNVLPTADARGQRQMTAIEIGLGPGMPTAAALATTQYSEFLASVTMDETFVPDSPDWKPEYVIRARKAEELRVWLTPERLKAIQTLLSMKSCMVLFFFDEIDAVLRVETADPLRNADRLTKLMKSLMAQLDRLAPAPSDAQKEAAAKVEAAQAKAAAAPAEAPSAPPEASAPAADPESESGDQPAESEEK